MRSASEIMASTPPDASAAFLPGPRLNPEALEQSEVIGLRELHTLAARLTKRTGAKHAALGRSLTRALHGEPFAADGSRNQTAYQLAGEIIEAYPFADPLSVLPHFLASLSLTGEPTPEQFCRQLETHQSKKQGKADTLRTLQETTRFGVPTPLLPLTVLAQTREVEGGPLGIDPVPGAPAADSPEARGTRDVIVVADGIYYVRHPQGETYELVLRSVESLRLELSNQFGNSNAVLNTFDPMGRMYANEIILAQYGCNATGGIVKDFSVNSTRFHFSTAVLRVGHRMLPAEHARPSVDVEKWLQQLAGGQETDLEDLYDWIASTDQQYIKRPSAALAIVGAKDCAKSLFARALAMTWGGINAVPMITATERFNGALQDCPIWHADEEMPKELTGHVFRDLVQSRDRLLEPKGQEKIRLIGAPRLVITVNQLEDIRIRGANGPEAVEAIADRIALFQAAPAADTLAALDRVRLPDSYDLDLSSIVAHLRFVQLHIQPREQRFYGGRTSSSAALSQVLAGAVDACPELFELFYRYFLDPTTIEREYHLEERAFAGGGRQFPIATNGQRFYVRYTELAARLNKNEWVIRGACKPFEAKTRGQGHTQLNFGAGRLRVRFIELDAARLIEALRVDVDSAIATVMVETRKRLNID